MPTNQMLIFMALFRAVKATPLCEFSFTVQFDSEADLKHAIHVLIGESVPDLTFKVQGHKITVFVKY